MLDSIRARLKRATDRRRQADRASNVLATERLLPEGLIGEPVQEIFQTRPQTADVSSLSRLEALKENEGRLGVEPQLREGKQRPKTSQSASRKRADGRLAGRSVEVVLSMENARGWPLGNRRSLAREPALKESPLQISTMPLRDPQASPRNHQSAVTSCDGKETAIKSSTGALQPSIKHRQPLRKSGDWIEERRAKTSHGSRGRSLEEDQSTVSPRKRVQSARYVNKAAKSDEGSPKDGQENIATINTQLDGSSPYKPRSESRVPSKSRLHLVDTAEKSPRKRPGSFRVSSALASALGTSGGSTASQENLVIQGNAQKKQERTEPVLKESSRAGAAMSKAKSKAVREAAGKKVAKETSFVRVGAPQLEWREKNPETEKEQLANTSSPEEPARRKSEGDEVPKKTAAISRRPRRRSLDSDSTLLPLSSGPVVNLNMLQGSANIFGSSVSTEHESLSHVSSFARNAASTLVDEMRDETYLSAPLEHTSTRSSLQQIHSSQTSKLPATLVSRGANRPSTPSPFAIVSRKNDSDENLQAAKERGLLVADCNVAEQPRKVGHPNPAQAASGGAARVSATKIQAERKVPEKRVQSELDDNESLDSLDESTGAGKPKHLRIEGPTETEGAPRDTAGIEALATSAKNEETRGDVRLDVTRPDSQAALVEGQQAEQQFASECAALIAWLDFSSEALIQDICEAAVLPVTPSPRLRAEFKKATHSPRTPSKGSPRGSPKGPPRSPRSGKQSPVSRLSPLWIPI